MHCFYMSIGVVPSNQLEKLPFQIQRCNRIRFNDRAAVQPVERVIIGFLSFPFSLNFIQLELMYSLLNFKFCSCRFLVEDFIIFLQSVQATNGLIL